VVSDPSSGKTVALNADKRFMAASLTKLPVLFTLYRAAARGEVDLEDEISILSSDIPGLRHRRALPLPRWATP
jgi:beta-lactamase class A